MKFSVVIPAHNAERYIAKAIASCLNQTFPPHEVVVVDDASTDGTVAVAESFAPQVRVIRLGENMGVSVARNRGVQESTGDWIAFLDADDWFLPEKLEMQRRCALENENAVLIYTGFINSVNGVETPVRFNPPASLRSKIRYRCAIHLSTVAVRRDAFEAVGRFDPSIRNCQDWDLWLRFAALYSVSRFTGVPEHLAVYRRIPGSLSSSAMRSFNARIGFLDARCLFGLAGAARRVWRCKIEAFIRYDIAIELRDQGSPLDLPFILKSIALWPFPWDEMPMSRYKIAAVMLRQHLVRRFLRSALVGDRQPS